MANIGTFKPMDKGGYEGTIVTMMTSRKVRFVPNDNKKTESSPDFFVKSGRCDLGVAWIETSEPDDDREPVDYISVKFDGPELEKPFNAALFDREDGADLVWTRAKPQ